ncbi:glucan endo-1,3-beta-glucosidase 6 [Syzygium oleosum]|uniref:glucan endo-1,3-beta-glucosidase 6 n=1 Tax=Syzygium oleosum TaxID=219896 RepID=UPI0011D1E6B2|nr:glucan endo-1,3-beta-glucosidase 6 [Syzygium oleosum]XP_030446589.1 glucan endo-1,3-beta-glucosidase 6 [Syzygium oleosum]XP_030446596.1 glucan endo-1,3-beta-glucosidase 6 [Syzygium oleosum]
MGWLVSLGLAWVLLLSVVSSVSGIGANWGTQATHPLPPATVVRMLRDNGFQKVKLFDADYGALRALGRTGIEVMVGIPNDMLASMAGSVKAAERWVSKNVSTHISSYNVNIRYVAVGNEPFLQTYNGSFLNTTYPALQNVQSALIRAGLSSQVKVTVPLNADVYESSTSLPSGGDFRAGIHDYMIQIVKFLSDNGGSFTVNIYPFISLYTDPNFPVEYAFFDGNASPVVDGSTTYYNMFDANYDTLVWALQKNGFGNLPVIVGEIGWPTDGDRNANLIYAQRFNQGFMSHISGGKGTPMRPGPIDVYLFSLIDEDAKSIEPGNFERHWGIFRYDGRPKYLFNLGTTSSNGLIPAQGVHYLEQKWCRLKMLANLTADQVAPSVSYACSLADCTSLGYGTSCGNLDAEGNISYAFNSYYQINNQLDSACKFSGLGTITRTDPSVDTCKFNIMIQPYYGSAGRLRGYLGNIFGLSLSLIVLLLMIL